MTPLVELINRDTTVATNLDEKRSFGRSRRRWEGKMKMVVGDTGYQMMMMMMMMMMIIMIIINYYYFLPPGATTPIGGCILQPSSRL